jgi:hypothetical protein
MYHTAMRASLSPWHAFDETDNQAVGLLLLLLLLLRLWY